MNSPVTQRTFFRDRQAAYRYSLATHPGAATTLPALLDQAFSDFTQQSTQACHGTPPLACGKGCSTCCTLRVTATAPEILLIARHLREQCAPDVCVRLVRRLLEADALTRGLGEQERVGLRQTCPFIEKRVCVIYPVRPLACRGHASYSRPACKQAAAGLVLHVPFSVPHQTARSLVQNALQSALRDVGVAWASYELNHGLRIALADSESESHWWAGHDVFFDARVDDVSQDDMAEAFDQLKAEG